MATKFKTAEDVMVSAARMGDTRSTFAMVKKTVDGVAGRSILVTHKGNSFTISSKRAHHAKNFGITVLRIGDIGSDATLLDPLAKSILQFARLLLPDDRVRLINVRTQVELKVQLATYGSFDSLLVIIGHGSSASITFVDGATSGNGMAQLLDPKDPSRPPSTVISLACETGAANFGREFSKASWCQDYIASFHAVNGAAASQFCQSLLTWHLLDGFGMDAAHRRAAASVPSGPSFRRWRNGAIAASRYSP